MDVQQLRLDFPLLQRKTYNRQIVYFDNAATTQKPSKVIDITSEYYQKYNSNIHRGVHYLSEKMTEAYENARSTVQKFINAQHIHEVIFTSGTTDSINLVAFSFGEKFVHEGDEVIVSHMEHHSNIVPWQMLCERKKAVLKVIPMNPAGVLDLDALESLISPKTKIVSVAHISNSLGTINPIDKIIAIAHKHNVPVMIDGAQGIQHSIVDVQKLDCDFYAFSGHKIYGPTGIGVLYGKEKWLNEMPPYRGGGDMIKNVSFEKTVYADLPFKFEAGTTNFIGAIGLSTALKYLNQIGMDKIIAYEEELKLYAHRKLIAIPNLTFYGSSDKKAGIFSFLINKIHHFDTGLMLDKMDIAVRTGTHCTEPVMSFFGIQGTVRVSLSFYNTEDEIDYLVESINKVKQLFK
ncbi:MAG: cysteine desulfurase CsdA [Bacteroidetes bacterium HGW-Bacteroidetes-21]|nr:MAG: cysteine desulfurase CsdA [Bacteroidetes bacterium HGW-Bacteroidetes-21]